MSDLHIAGPDCPRQQAFLRFLATLQCDRLCLCGDVFEHWWHWGSIPFPQYAQVVEALAPFTLTVLPGNHDWHVHEFFRDRGAQIPGPDGMVRTSWDGVPVLLAHGDQADRSAGYAALSWVLRGRPFRALVNAMSPAQAWRFLGRISGNGTVRQNLALIAQQLVWAGELPGDVVIYGHTHAPGIQRVGHRALVNIGDGVSHGTYVLFDTSVPGGPWVRKFADPLQDGA